MAATKDARPRAAGKKAAVPATRSTDAGWSLSPDRPGPVHGVVEAEKGRMLERLPLRHGRMVRSKFTLHRGTRGGSPELAGAQSSRPGEAAP